MKLDKDKAALTVSILALLTSIASPFISYRWLNQVERDERDRKQLTAWLETGGGGVTGGIGSDDSMASSDSYTLWARKDGALSVPNVQFILQFEPGVRPYMHVEVHSDIETEPPVIDDDGRVRIRLKNQLAPTVKDLKLDIEVSLAGHSKDKVFSGLNGDLKGAWLFSDAISEAPISLTAHHPTDQGSNRRSR